MQSSLAVSTTTATESGRLTVMTWRLKLDAQQSSGECQLAHNTAAAWAVRRRVRRTNNTMLLAAVTSATADDRQRRTTVQAAGADKWRRACTAGRQQVWLEVSFQRSRQRQLINTVYCCTSRNCPTAKLLQWQY